MAEILNYGSKGKERFQAKQKVYALYSGLRNKGIQNEKNCLVKKQQQQMI